MAESKEFDDLISAMDNFYRRHQGLDGFGMQPNQIFVGMRIAAFACGQWCRAEVIKKYNENSDFFKLFFIDYGTTGDVNLRFCKFLVEQFSVSAAKAFRGALYGVQPRGRRRLWDLNITDKFIEMIRDKIHTIEIVKYHEMEDFYEFLLMNGSESINIEMARTGIADFVEPYETLPSCLSYPTFDMLERLSTYPTFGERMLVLARTGVDLNIFEEEKIPLIKGPKEFEKKLEEVLSDESLANIKNIFKQHRIRFAVQKSAE